MERYGLVVTREGVLQLSDESDVEVSLVIETETREEAEKLRFIFGTKHTSGVFNGQFLSSIIRNEAPALFSHALARLRATVSNTYEELKQRRDKENYKVTINRENAEQALRYLEANSGGIKTIPYKFIHAFLKGIIDSLLVREEPNVNPEPPPTHPSVRE